MAVFSQFIALEDYFAEFQDTNLLTNKHITGIAIDNQGIGVFMCLNEDGTDLIDPVGQPGFKRVKHFGDIVQIDRETYINRKQVVEVIIPVDKAKPQADINLIDRRQIILVGDRRAAAQALGLST